ncbi:DUF2570 domain-containing protein [Morganella morganii]|uniref:DUF2570 domain-containing protein n=1 Tax=Morganella morganii TaxID=582 RepID=UPI002543CB23|nr:DUF2570 domain-containing protein [Morganella morganii]HDS3052866.1 DUF2570 domain-containing protein [Morganella morganii subsp. morganii]HDU8711511.1 DUF2570 domain-containing protein [Morganella morganii subsp. morganii]
MTTKARIIPLLFSLLIAGLLSFGLKHYYDKAGRLTAENDGLKNDIRRQAGVIAAQSFEFNRFNQIAQAATQNNISQRAASEEHRIEYRTILKKDPTCDLPVPRAVSDGLLRDTYRLRSRTMHPAAGLTDKAGAAVPAARVLTYCELPLWIDLLLADLDEANTQLEGIRAAEKARQHEKTEQH